MSSKWPAALNDDVLSSLPAQKAEKVRKDQEDLVRCWESFGPWDLPGATATRVFYAAYLMAASAHFRKSRSPPAAGSMSALSDNKLDDEVAVWLAALRSAEKGELWHIKGHLTVLLDDVEALCRFVEKTARPGERAKLLDHVLGMFTTSWRLGALTGRNGFAERTKAARARSGVASRIEQRRRELSAAVLAEVQKNPKGSDRQIAKGLKRSGVKIATTGATLIKDIELIRADALRSNPVGTEKSPSTAKKTS